MQTATLKNDSYGEPIVTIVNDDGSVVELKFSDGELDVATVYNEDGQKPVPNVAVNMVYEPYAPHMDHG